MTSFLAAALLLLALSQESVARASVIQGCPYSIKYSTVEGYFLQDDPATDPETFDYVRRRFICLS